MSSGSCIIGNPYNKESNLRSKRIGKVIKSKFNWYYMSSFFNKVNSFKSRLNKDGHHIWRMNIMTSINEVTP